MSNDIWRLDAVEVAEGIRARKFSAREAVESTLARMTAVNGALNAVSVPLAESALAEAGSADRAQARGESLGPLHGVPVTIKENVDQAGCATTNGVVAFEGVVAAEDSPQVANWKMAGAIVVGRTNTPAFSYRWDTDNALRGRTFNPWSRSHVPGGSSGGAAAAVAAGIGHLAHGNDYGGSIRYPAYCCGVAGLRPSLGRVPAFNGSNPVERGMTAQLMSVQGPIARRVRDLRLGLEAMAVRDPHDPWWVPAPLEGLPLDRPVRVAMAADWGGAALHPHVEAALERAVRSLTDAGYAVDTVSPPGAARLGGLWRELMVCEMRVLLADQIARDGDAGIKAASGHMDRLTPPLTLEGYVKALAERNKWLREWSLFMEQYPIVLAPCSLQPPLEIGFDTTTAARMAEALRAQEPLYAVNLLGLPSVAVPTGIAGGLPQGVQLVGRRFREDLCLDAAEAIEARHPLPTPIDPVAGT